MYLYGGKNQIGRYKPLRIAAEILLRDNVKHPVRIFISICNAVRVPAYLASPLFDLTSFNGGHSKCYETCKTITFSYL